jgi:hypothetical protein
MCGLQMNESCIGYTWVEVEQSVGVCGWTVNESRIYAKVEEGMNI